MTTQTTEVATSAKPKKSITGIITSIVRILMGLMFLVFGLNGFLDFIPMPKDPPPTPATIEFITALKNSHYMFPVIFGTMALVGVLLLINRWVPLALALIAPIIVGIVGFHLGVNPDGFPMAVVVLVMELFLAFAYRESFKPMLKMKVTPGRS